jgi:hypothetical protein
MSPSTGRPRHQERGPEGEQPHQRLPRVCATGRSEAEDGEGEHEHWRQPMSRSEAEGLLCDPEPQGEPTRSRRPDLWR